MRWVQLAMLLALACRDPVGDPPVHLYLESFEEVCDDVPCGWAQLEGPAGTVRFVSTVHPGEHGLRLDAGVAARGPASTARSARAMFGTLQAALSARCDPGATLVLEAAVRATARDVVDTFRGRASPPEVWSDVITTTTLTGDLAGVDGGIGDAFGGPVDIRIDGLTLRVEGSGRCEVDHLVIDDLGNAIARPSGCE